MKISQLWGIVDVSLHTSFELSEGNSSEILVVQNFTVQKCCAKVAALMAVELGILYVENEECVGRLIKSPFQCCI